MTLHVAFEASVRGIGVNYQERSLELLMKWAHGVITIVLFASLSPISPVAAESLTLSAALPRVGQELRTAWNADPSTAPLPWPSIVLLAPGDRWKEQCPTGLASSADARSAYCPGKNEVILESRPPHSKANPDVVMWEAALMTSTALGQLIRAKLPSPGPNLSSAAAELQTICLGAVLLSASPALRPPASGTAVVSPSINFLDTGVNDLRLASQRSFALLSGFGGTSVGCTDTAMAALAEDMVPTRDRQLLDDLIPDKGLRGVSDFGPLLDRLCRRPGGCRQTLRAVDPARARGQGRVKP